jgi:hypothetical protein
MAGIGVIETTSAEFEAALKAKGYQLEDSVIDTCKGAEHKRTVTWYCQDDGEGIPGGITSLPNKQTSLSWSKRVGCAECVSRYLAILDCGGHYHNLRFYSVRSDGKEGLWENDPAFPCEKSNWFEIQPLDPWAPIYDEESSDSDTGEGEDKKTPMLTCISETRRCEVCGLAAVKGQLREGVCVKCGMAALVSDSRGSVRVKCEMTTLEIIDDCVKKVAAVGATDSSPRKRGPVVEEVD